MNLLVKILSVILTITVIIQISFLEIDFGNAYYVIALLAFGLLFFIGQNYTMNYIMLWFIIVAFLSIVLNDIPEFFQPYLRFAVFIVVMGLVGPFIHNTALDYFRFKLGYMLNTTILVMVIISFIGIVAGLPLMVGRGGFAGLFNHSMMLGPMAAIAIIVALHRAYLVKSKKKFWFFISLAAIAFVTCVASGSRSALLAGIAGGLFFYYKINQGKIRRFARIVLIVITLGVLSFPAWELYTERIMEKVSYSESKGDVFATRAALWQMRLDEFISSPLIGVGFASVDTKISTKVDKDEGKIEPGSSWLALLSMTGLCGFILVMILVFKYIVYIIKNYQNPVYSALLGGILFFFLVHMIAEGYILSAGSGLFFYLWLTMGCIDISKNKS